MKTPGNPGFGCSTPESGTNNEEKDVWSPDRAYLQNSGLEGFYPVNLEFLVVLLLSFSSYGYPIEILRHRILIGGKQCRKIYVHYISVQTIRSPHWLPDSIHQYQDNMHKHCTRHFGLKKKIIFSHRERKKGRDRHNHLK